MKNCIVFLVLLISLHFSAVSQSRFQLAILGGPTLTSKIKYNNCTGYINPVVTGTLALLYRPNSSFGIELKFSALSPKSYLNNDTSNSVKIYSTSRIMMQRILGGFNYYLPFKSVHPFLGLLIGASYAQTTEIEPESSIINFNYGLQTGVIVNVNKLMALRLDACSVFIPNVSDNTSYFNVAADGSGFPGFVIGNSSKANITQLNINLGLLINFDKRNK